MKYGFWAGDPKETMSYRTEGGISIRPSVRPNKRASEHMSRPLRVQPPHLCPAVHILGYQNVYGRTEDIADHYWPWAVFYLFCV